MEVSQEQQYRSFEEEWKGYLGEFRTETSRKLEEQRQQQKEQMMEEQGRFMQRLEKTNTTTSPRLR